MPPSAAKRRDTYLDDESKSIKPESARSWKLIADSFRLYAQRALPADGYLPPIVSNMPCTEILRFAQYSGHMSSLFFEEIYCFFLKKCNLNTPPGKSIFSNIFRRSIFLFQRYHYFVIGIQLMFIQ